MGSDKPKREAKPVAKYMPEEPKASTKPKKTATKASSAKAAKKPGEKKPLVGYMLFCQHNREAAKTKLPSGLASKEMMPAVSKILGEMWSKESEANKTAWKAGKAPK